MGKGTFERAFDLARMDSCRTVEDIGWRIPREAYSSVAAHLAGAGIRKQLKGLMVGRKAGPPGTNPRVRRFFAPREKKDERRQDRARRKMLRASRWARTMRCGTGPPDSAYPRRVFSGLSTLWAMVPIASSVTFARVRMRDGEQIGHRTETSEREARGHFDQTFGVPRAISLLRARMTRRKS